MKKSEALKYTLEDIKQLNNESQVKALELQINYHNELYFIQNTTEISDTEFDQLVELLKELDPNNPVLFELVGDVGRVTHSTPMLSIEKKYNHKDVIDWANKIESAQEFIIQPKYDGMAARYSNNILATRGNGVVGEDITHRLKDLKIIGKLEPESEGEILIPNIYFEKNLKDTYKNPRNATVGIIKSKKVKDKALQALQDKGVHFVIYSSNKSIIVNKAELNNLETFESLVEEIFISDYLLDGVVIKVADKNVRNQLGYTAHHHKWQIAYKINKDVKKTKIINIIDSVGRTGRITSVAQLDPVDLSGATITNVTLHNLDYMTKLGIGIGSIVEITRAGEVIPYITRTISATHNYEPPKTCPSCSSELEKSQKYLQCVNPDCPAKLALSFEYFFKTLDVKELGNITIAKLMDELGIKQIIDFYKIKSEDISKIDGFGERSAELIVTNIQNTLNEQITPVDLLAAIGIESLGKPTAKKILNRYSISDLENLTLNNLIEIDGFAEKKAQIIINGIKEKYIIIAQLLQNNLKFKVNKENSTIRNKSFAITGKKQRYSREELIELIEHNGGDYKKSITNDLDYLIAGDNAGSKLNEAKQKGISIISEAQFLNIINH